MTRETHRMVVIWSRIMAERPEPKREDKSKREAEGRRALIPTPSVLLLAAPSISFIPPSLPLWWSPVCFGLKPTKSLTVLKPEQHGGELNHNQASWESKFLTEGWTDIHTARLLRSKQEKNVFFYITVNKCCIMTLCPSNDAITWPFPHTNRSLYDGATAQIFLCPTA